MMDKTNRHVSIADTGSPRVPNPFEMAPTCDNPEKAVISISVRRKFWFAWLLLGLVWLLPALWFAHTIPIHRGFNFSTFDRHHHEFRRFASAANNNEEIRWDAKTMVQLSHRLTDHHAQLHQRAFGDTRGYYLDSQSSNAALSMVIPTDPDIDASNSVVRLLPEDIPEGIEACVVAGRVLVSHEANELRVRTLDELNAWKQSFRSPGDDLLADQLHNLHAITIAADQSSTSVDEHRVLFVSSDDTDSTRDIYRYQLYRLTEKNTLESIAEWAADQSLEVTNHCLDDLTVQVRLQSETSACPQIPSFVETNDGGTNKSIVNRSAETGQILSQHTLPDDVNLDFAESKVQRSLAYFVDAKQTKQKQFDYFIAPRSGLVLKRGPGTNVPTGSVIVDTDTEHDRVLIQIPPSKVPSSAEVRSFEDLYRLVDWKSGQVVHQFVLPSFRYGGWDGKYSISDDDHVAYVGGNRSPTFAMFDIRNGRRIYLRRPLSRVPVIILALTLVASLWWFLACVFSNWSGIDPRFDVGLLLGLLAILMMIRGTVFSSSFPFCIHATIVVSILWSLLLPLLLAFLRRDPQQTVKIVPWHGAILIFGITLGVSTAFLCGRLALQGNSVWSYTVVASCIFVFASLNRWIARRFEFAGVSATSSTWFPRLSVLSMLSATAGLAIWMSALRMGWAVSGNPVANGGLLQTIMLGVVIGTVIGWLDSLLHRLSLFGRGDALALLILSGTMVWIAICGLFAGSFAGDNYLGLVNDSQYPNLGLVLIPITMVILRTPTLLRATFKGQQTA